jgi:hypothetical protein
MAITDTVNSFFGLVGTEGSQDIPSIKNLFVPDKNPPGPPNIGLTTGGPQFLGQDGIDDLFTTLSNTFSQYGFDPASGPNTVPQPLAGANKIAVEAILTTGHVQKKWHPHHVKATPPLSKIEPAGGDNTQLPVCAVFTMDDDGNLYRIINLALYFDRWKLAQDKWDKNNPPHIDKDP